MQAPDRIEKPIGRPRIPTPMGSCPYTLNACVGQKSRIETKFAPEMKVMTSVKARILGSCLRREGNMGNFAPLTSQMQNKVRRKAPRRSGTRTWAVAHLYCLQSEPDGVRRTEDGHTW